MTARASVLKDQAVLSAEQEAFKRELMAALMPHVREMDLPRLVARFGSLEAVAERMIAAIPDVGVNDPAVGPCHTRARLATWQGVSRQAVAKQQHAGRIIGVLHQGRILLPTIQFDGHGRPLPLLRELLEVTDGPLNTADRVAEWLHDPTGPDGTTRAERLEAARAASDAHPLPDETLTIIHPPKPDDSEPAE